MNISDVRVANLRAWVREHGVPTKEKSYFSQLLGGSSPFGERAARRLERDYRMGALYLDTPDAAVPQAAAEQPRAPESVPSGWPFKSIQEADVRALPQEALLKLEGAIALAVAQLNLGMDVAPLAAAISAPAPAPDFGQMGHAANESDFIAVPHKAVRIRAGVAGFSLDQTAERNDGTVYVSRKWFEKRGLNESKVFATTVGGQSMSPRVQEGDVVLINTADTERRNGHVYGFNHEGEFVLKRLKRQLNKWWLTSDNEDKKAFPPTMAEDGTFMIGRAILLHIESI